MITLRRVLQVLLLSAFALVASVVHAFASSSQFMQHVATSGGPVSASTIVTQASTAIRNGDKVYVYPGLETYIPQQQLTILQSNLKRIPPALPVFASVVPPVTTDQNASALPALIQKATKLSGTYVVIIPVPGHEFVGGYSTNPEINQLIAAVIKAQGQGNPVQGLQSIVSTLSAVSPVPAATAVMKASTTFGSGTHLFVYQTGLTQLIPAKDMQLIQGKLPRSVYVAILPPVTGQNASALPTLIQAATKHAGTYAVIIPVPGHEFIGGYSTDPAIESALKAKLHGNKLQELDQLFSLLGHGSTGQGSNSATGVTILGKHTGLAIGAVVGILVAIIVVIILVVIFLVRRYGKKGRARRASRKETR